MAKDDNFLRLKQQIKTGSCGNLYLFFGEEIYVKDMYLEHMKKLVPDGGFADFNHIFLSAKDLENGTLTDVLDSFPMMSDRKLVVIKNSGLFKSAPSSAKEFWQKKLADIPEYILLIFDEQEVDKRSITYKALSKHGLCVEFAFMKSYEISAWASREALKAGKKLSKDAAEYLVSLCDPGISNVRNELNKLINYCGSEIYRSDIDKVVSRPMSLVVFEITDALMTGNIDKALSVIIRMREAKESAHAVLYLLSSAFDKMLYAKLLLNEGMSYDVVTSRLKLAPFIAKKYIDGAKGFSEEFLINRIKDTAECDLSIKQGEIDEWSALFEYVFKCVKKN